MRNFHLVIPNDCLVDDAYLSYAIYNKGFKIGYEADAKVFVKYPTYFKDWMAQKLRSAGGFVQLWKYNVIHKETKVRNFYKELEYFWFPLKYAQNLKEFIWSLILYPIRFYMWVRIYWERKVLNKDFSKTWTVIKSTK
jgi:cellulose synthase/poly-beta-1,6-N-acetylglucosamine synthase-like glycosyltransferase